LNPGIFLSGASCTLAGVTYNPCSTAGNSNARRRLALAYPNVGGSTIAFLSQWEAQGTQSYHGLLLNLQRRPVRGVSVTANYTLSHCISDFSSQTGSGGTPGATYLDANNRHFDRGNCQTDRRQIFNLTSLAEVPRFENHALRLAASGWRLSGIYTRSSGAPLTVTSGTDRVLNGVQNQRALQLSSNPYGNGSLQNFLNPGAFTAPDLGSLGNMGPYTVRGPSLWSFNLALSRIFNIRESQKIEARYEVYNPTNSLVRGNPVTILNSAIFGQIN